MQIWDMNMIKDNTKIKAKGKENAENEKKKEAIKSEKLRYKNADEIYE